ncbi:MAG TPA: ComEA family DNA-binding protein [Gemmataceae bacterium]|nr:ComEA family DNA-binding protein [Gemmataceae bacterium]
MQSPASETSKSAWPGWTAGVQLALAFLVVGAISFLLGRWSLAGNQPAPIIDARVPDKSAPRDRLDLNIATPAELRLVPGIGDALAQRIVDYRTRQGRIKSVEDLRQVSGIGPKTLERIRPHLFVTGDSFVAAEETESMSAETTAKPVRAASTSKKASGLTALININRADQAELQKLPGIGPKLSQRILDERARSPFKSIDELRRVSGIGPKTLDKLRPHVTVDTPQAIASSVQE